ncbi:MAG: hypothetical protein ABF636_03675 [Acetobacter sp.]
MSDAVLLFERPMDYFTVAVWCATYGRQLGSERGHSDYNEQPPPCSKRGIPRHIGQTKGGLNSKSRYVLQQDITAAHILMSALHITASSIFYQKVKSPEPMANVRGLVRGLLVVKSLSPG